MRTVCILLSSLLVAFGAPAANAADLMRGTVAPEAPAPAIEPIRDVDWSGIYFGVQGGHSWGKDRTSEYFTATGAFVGLSWDFNANSGVGGVHAGVAYQFGSFVVGAEADVEKTNARGGFTDPAGAGTLRNPWRASLRAKAGISFGRFMPYITGGVAFADLKYIYTNVVGPIEERTCSTRTGYTYGFGLAYAFSDHWRAHAEFRVTEFGHFDYPSTVAFPGLTGRQEPKFQTVRVGASYRF